MLGHGKAKARLTEKQLLSITNEAIFSGELYLALRTTW